MVRCNESQLDFGESVLALWNFTKLRTDRPNHGKRFLFSFSFLLVYFVCLVSFGETKYVRIDGHLKEVRSLEILIDEEGSLSFFLFFFLSFFLSEDETGGQARCI